MERRVLTRGMDERCYKSQSYLANLIKRMTSYKVTTTKESRLLTLATKSSPTSCTNVYQYKQQSWQEITNSVLEIKDPQSTNGLVIDKSWKIQ